MRLNGGMVMPSIQTAAQRARPDRRDVGRLAVALEAKLLVGPRSFDCRLIDLSPTGARLAVENLPAIFSPATLRIGEAGSLRCKVIWRDAKRAGLHFLEDPEIVAMCVRRLRMA